MIWTKPAHFRLRFVRRLQTRGYYEVRQPERCRWIDRVRRIIRTVVAIPRSRAPSPPPIHWRRPRIVGPSIENRVIVVAGIVAVIWPPAPVVAAIDPDAICPVIVVGS